MDERQESVIGRREVLAGVIGLSVVGRRLYGQAATAPASMPASSPATTQPTSMPFQEPPKDALWGRVVYIGKAPTPEIVDCSADPHCAYLYRKKPLRTENLHLRRNLPDGLNLNYSIIELSIFQQLM